MDGLIRHVMKRSQYVSVRDVESADLLVRMGVSRESVQIVPDPVMGLPPPVTAQAAREETASHFPSGGGHPGSRRRFLRRWRKDGADLPALQRHWLSSLGGVPCACASSRSIPRGMRTHPAR